MRVPANLFVVVALAGSLLFASPALAQDDEEEEYPIDPTLTGVYLGASMGVAWDDFREAGEFSPSQLSSLIVGYRGSEYISLESEFEWLAGFQRKDEEIDGWMTSLGFRVHFPIGRLEPYLTYGAGILHVEGRGASLGRVNATDFAFLGGGGLAFQWTDRFSIFAEGMYTYPISGVQRFDHGSLRFGLLYKLSEEY
jgi:opacity protein-like surface antigen